MSDMYTLYEKLSEILSQLTHELRASREQRKTEFDCSKSQSEPATKHDLRQTEENIMSKITDWASEEEADLTTISITLDGIVTGVTALDALITALQNSPGTLSTADQNALDAIQVASKALVSKSSAISVAPPTNPNNPVSPTLDPVSNVSVLQDSNVQTVNLTGISSTSGNPINVAAASSDSSVVADPLVTYMTPNTTATLALTPVPGASGNATITVTVSDSVANAVQTFTYTVTSVSASARRR